MQIKTFTAAAIGLSLSAAWFAVAQAGTYAPGCTKEPQSAWKTIDTSAAKAAALGYVVSKTKLTGTCHEIYVTKDGKKFELFFNPVSNDLVHTAAK